MPITLNHSNIGVQYNTGSNYIIETVKSDLYLRNEIVDTIVRDNIQTAPVTPSIYIENTSNVYAVESYTYSESTNTANYTRVFPKNTTCDILVVGGGGSGSANHGGGGGAGAVVFIKSVVLNTGTYTINVGKGGSATNFTANDISGIGNKGVDSKIIFNSSEILKAEGGGAGGESHTSGNGGSGGSGGGADGYTATALTNNSGGGTVGSSSIFTYNGITGVKYGNAGGNRNIVVADNAGSGGGGGGAGSQGSTSSSPYIGASGGNGVCNAIINSVTYDFSSMFGNSYGVNNDGNNNRYFGGGGGSSYWNRSGYTPSRTSALGGKGGGGDGGFNNGTTAIIATNGINNSGGGGGGGGPDGDLNIRNGGAGGSGIVIIRYLVGTIPTNNLLTTEPTVTPYVLITDGYYPRIPSTNSATWIDNGYTVNVKVSDPLLYNQIYHLFNHIITTDDHYHSTAIYANNGNTTYSGTTSFKGNAGIAFGIDLGRPIYPKRTRIAPRANHPEYGSQLTSAPGTFKIYASNNPSSWNDNNHIDWVLIHSQTSAATFVNSQYTIISLSNTPSISYRYYTMVVMTLAGNYAYLAFSEWSIGGDEKFDGIPEDNAITHKRLNFAYDLTKNVEYQAQLKTGVGGWRIVRFLPPNLGRWYSGNNFTSTSVNSTNIGTAYNYTNEWGIPFGTFDEMFFATFDTTYWLRCLKTSVLGTYTNELRPIISSSSSSIPYSARWYQRDSELHEPWISINDYATTPQLMLYVENSQTASGDLRNAYGGMCVLVRDSTSGTTISNPNTYTLNFPVPTIADINNNSNIVLRGAYDISLSSMNSSIIPKSNQYIPKPTTFSTSNLSVRYNLLNPVLDPSGAQWTYNSSNTNVYHMGNVGIGTKSPEYQLDVRGFIHTSVGGYTQTGSENWIIQSDRRIKENIVKASYDKCLENVKNIELYNFNFKDNCVNTNDRHQLGFIAQEVQQVYPKAVEVGKIILDNNQGINDLLTLNTTQIKYTLYGAVKNLIERVENIESRVEQIYNMTLSSNFKSPSSNISISIINTSNMTANTSNITANTSNITVSTSNIAVSTSNIAVITSNVAVSTSNVAVSTSNITANTSNINTSNV